MNSCISPFTSKRYVDDILLICLVDSIEQLLRDVNSWHTSVRLSHEIADSALPFLDLLITKVPLESACGFKYSTYRKPLGQSLYLPFNSCHPPSVTRALVLGELARLLATNMCKEDFEQHVSSFFQQLVRRGYPHSLLDDCLRRRGWHSKSNGLRAQSSVESEPPRHVIPFKIPFWHGAERLSLTASLHRHVSLCLGQGFASSIRIVTCFTSSPNLFRIRFRRFQRFFLGG